MRQRRSSINEVTCASQNSVDTEKFANEGHQEIKQLVLLKIKMIKKCLFSEVHQEINPLFLLKMRMTPKGCAKEGHQEMKLLVILKCR